MRVKLILEYDGTDYAGWQYQNNAVTVQECLEKALMTVMGKPVRCVAAGRTDAGVHAAGQTVHCDVETSIPADRLSFVLNTVLPRDIRVMHSEEAAPDFNARFDAKSKTYRYAIACGRHDSPLLGRTHYCVHVPLDTLSMRKAAEFIVGTHDFKAFCATGSSAKTTVRTVHSCDILTRDNIIEIEITGNGFLYNMVRIIAGTLVQAGMGKISPDDVEKIIASGDRRLAGPTLPPHGLCLMKVYYDTI